MDSNNQSNKIKSVLWDITGKCNLNCKHCYTSMHYKQSKLNRNDLTFEQIVQALLDLKEQGINHIHFLGGEPLLRKDLIDIIIEAKKRDFTISIGTNGVNLEPEVVLKFKKYGVDKVMISVDGASEFINDEIRGKGTFNKCISNLKDAIKISNGTSMIIGITFTANSFNYHQIPDLFKLALEHHVKEIYIVPIQKYGNYNENNNMLKIDEKEFLTCFDKALELYSEEMRGKVKISTGLRYWPIDVLNRKYSNIIAIDKCGVKCSGGNSYFVIQADGRIGPCFAFIDKFVENSNEAFLTSRINSEYINSLNTKCIHQTETFKQFYEFKSKNDICKKLMPCNRCRFFKKQCEPCPIKYMDDNSIEQCLWAEKIEKEERKKFIMDCYSLSDKFSLSDEGVLDETNGKYIRLGSTLTYVISRMIKESIDIKTILEKSFDNKLTKEQFEEIVQALEQLKEYGILKK